MSNVGNSWDAIVVGSGLGGMSAAAHLAALGRRVLVLEQYDVVGGSSHVFRRERKWEWEVGVHHMADCGPGGIVPTLFDSLGGADRVQFVELDPKGVETYSLPGMTFTTPRGWDNYQARLIEAFPDEEDQIRRFVRLVRQAGRSFDRDRAPAAMLRAVPSVVRSGSALPLLPLPMSFVFSLFRFSPALQIVLSPPFGSLNVPPARLPFAAYAVFQHMFIAGGTWYPKGGGQVLTAHLANVVNSLGGQIQTNAPVSTIAIEDRTVTGVVLEDGRRFTAPVVVSNADIKRTYLDLVGRENLRPRTVRRVKRYRMAMPFFNVYLGSSMNLSETAPARDAFIYPTLVSMDEFEKRLMRPAQTSDDWLRTVRDIAPVYMHCSNLKDPSGTRYAPKGCSSVEVMMPMPYNPTLWGTSWGSGTSYRRNSEYLKMKESIADILTSRIDEIFPGFAESVVYREVSTPLTQERYTRTTEGSAYGIEINLMQSGPLRPTVRTEIKGLYLTGSSTSWGPGTEAALLSGRWAAAAISGRDLQAEAIDGKRFVDPTQLSPFEPGWDPLEFVKNLALHNRTTKRAQLAEAKDIGNLETDEP